MNRTIVSLATRQGDLLVCVVVSILNPLLIGMTLSRQSLEMVTVSLALMETDRQPRGPGGRWWMVG